MTTEQLSSAAAEKLLSHRGQWILDCDRKRAVAEHNKGKAVREMGEVLLEVKARELYREMDGQYRNWTDFLRHGFPAITGLEARTAQGAMKLAKALQDEDPSELDKVPNVSNLHTIRKVKESGRPITPEIMQQAQTLPNGELCDSVGVSKGFLLRVWIEDVEAGKELKELVGMVSGISPDAARAFREVFATALKMGAGPDNAVDYLVGLTEPRIQDRSGR
jgi:hypothetical protein